MTLPMMDGMAGGAKITKDSLGQLGKVNIDVTPKPAAVVGTSGMGSATTITGNPDGTKNGIGDAKEGTYTYNPDCSVTVSGNGRAIRNEI